MTPGIDYTGVTVCFFCHDGAGNFLMARRSQKCRDEQGRWECGGGRLEFGEDPEEGVLREVREEYGCSGVIEERLHPRSIIREHKGRKTHWLALPYVIRVNPAAVRISEPEYIDEIGWFPLGGLPQPLHTGFAMQLEAYRPILQKYQI